jgi:hypothetical protein
VACNGYLPQPAPPVMEPGLALCVWAPPDGEGGGTGDGNVALLLGVQDVRECACVRACVCLCVRVQKPN